MKRGLFIAFEGIDGCGKSTQAWKLGKYISNINKYNHVVMTREPWKNADIRKILTSDSDPYSQAKQLAELFVKDRKEHMKILISKNIIRGAHFISDRYSLSTLAYQQTQGIDLQDLLKMHKGLPIAEIIFLVDLPVKIALERMRKDNQRKTEQKFEKNVEFIEKLRRTYLELAKELKNHNIIIIDGTKKPDDIFEKQIKPAFDKFYKNY